MSIRFDEIKNDIEYQTLRNETLSIVRFHCKYNAKYKLTSLKRKSGRPFVASDKRYHFIYIIVSNDSEYYIGKHSTFNLNDGYLGSGVKIEKKQYSGNELHLVPLQFFNTEDEAFNAEQKMIGELWFYDCDLNGSEPDENCLNMIPGGKNGKLHIDQLIDLREVERNKTVTGKEVLQEVFQLLKKVVNKVANIPKNSTKIIEELNQHQKMLIEHEEKKKELENQIKVAVEDVLRRK